MSSVLIGKGLLLEGSTPKTKDKKIPGIKVKDTTSRSLTKLLVDNFNHVHQLDVTDKN